MFIIVQMPLSLTTVLILCVDLGTDMIPAISLAYEKPEADIMERPPRNAETDRLVTDRLMCFAYLQIGVFQALAGFYSDTIPGNAMGFFPYPGATTDDVRYIMGSDDKSSTMGSDEKSPCPCGAGQQYALAAKPLHKTAKAKDMASESAWSVIVGGTLPDPNAGTATALPASIVNSCPASNIGITIGDELVAPDWPYGYGCPYGSVKPTKKCKFKATDTLPTVDTAPPCYKASEALGHAQTSAFVSIVIVQWADLLICKTRSLSIYHQGMKNPILIFGMFSETLLCLCLCYVPGIDQGLGTRPLSWIHWCPSFPYSVLIFLYDETRKFKLRRDRKRLPAGTIGFVERFSYY